MESRLNPWARANLEQFDVETLALIPQGQQQEYIAVMKELAHARAIAALVLEQMFQKEQDRAAFFEPFITPPAMGGSAVNTPESANNGRVINTEAPEGASHICARDMHSTEVDTPDYTPVTDLNEYRSRHV